MVRWWQHSLILLSSPRVLLRLCGAREGLKFSCQCLNIHLVQDVLAEQGHISHDCEGDILHILLESFAHATRDQ